MSEHQRLAEWDAAYVLGALGAADRAEFEEHLEHCDACRDAVAELAPIPGLLARVPAERAEELLGPADAGREALLDLGAHRARRRRGRRLLTALAAAAAAVALLFAGSALDLLRPAAETEQGPDATVAMEPVDAAPLRASIGMTTVPWGTKLDVTCSYEADAYGRPGGGEYELVAIGADGQETSLSTWHAQPGSTALFSAGTALPAEEIQALEIRAADTGAVLMRSG